jgi:hypothetical protein
VNPAAGYVNIGGNAAAHVQQGVQLYRTFLPAKLRPRKQAQAQIHGGGIERVYRVGQFDSQRLLLIKLSGDADQNPRKIGKDAPVAMLVGIGQRRPMNPTAEAHVVELGLLHFQTGLDIAEAFAIS